MTTNTAALVQQLRNALKDARDDVQAELQRCTELAGRPSTDRRLAFQEQQAKDVDAAIAAADQWLAAPQSVAQPLTDEQIAVAFGWKQGFGPLYSEVITTRIVERAHGIGQPARDTKPCRCGPDGCADSACPGRTSCATT